MTMLPDSQILWAQDYEGYYQYIGNYPSDREYFISNECQGVTHDTSHWFFSTRWKLYKIPVTVDLNADNTAVAVSQHVDDLPGNHNHLGDPDYCSYIDRGYVFVPLEGGIASIAVFWAGDLSFLSQKEVSQRQDNHASWVAIYPVPTDGGRSIYLYSSAWENVSTLQFYRVDLELLYTNGQLTMDYVGDFSLSITIDGVQGGEFSPSGELLYLSSNSNGISVFHVENEAGTLLRNSSKDTEPFKFEWHGGFPDYEEPEGLTIWDLDDGYCPNISGQLHVVLLDNDSNDDDLYFKHYTHKIYVDEDSTSEYYGKPDQPYNTVGEAIYLAWDGQEIVIKAGFYPENSTIDKKLRLRSKDGTAIFGNENNIVLAPQGIIDIWEDGTLVIY